ACGFLLVFPSRPPRDSRRASSCRHDPVALEGRPRLAAFPPGAVPSRRSLIARKSVHCRFRPTGPRWHGQPRPTLALATCRTSRGRSRTIGGRPRIRNTAPGPAPHLAAVPPQLFPIAAQPPKSRFGSRWRPIHMKREILINANPRETRVAIIEDDQLVALLVHRPAP